MAGKVDQGIGEASGKVSSEESPLCENWFRMTWFADCFRLLDRGKSAMGLIALGRYMAHSRIRTPDGSLHTDTPKRIDFARPLL